MIKIYLSRLLRDSRITVAELHRQTGLDNNTISRLYHGRTRSISFITINRIYLTLQREVGDLLEHVVDQ